jgi:rfaE bifunctional protein kinase chain/domain
MIGDLDKIFQDIANLKVAVIGDVMLDTYWWGSVDRISPEGPVPVVALTKKELRIGGAGNVALNLRALATDVAILSVIGKDEDGDQLKKLLQSNKIDTRYMLHSDKRMTTNKIRIIGRNQQMIRIDAERSNDLEDVEEEQLINHLEQYIQSEKPQVIILQDCNKGVLTERVITKVIELCSEHGIISTADPKRKNFFAFKNVTLL